MKSDGDVVDYYESDVDNSDGRLSPDTDVNDDAYWVVSSGNVGFGDGVNYDSYGYNSPDTYVSALHDGTIYINSGGMPKDDKSIHDSYGV